MDCTLLRGDCLEVMAAMDAGSVDAVCTDSPYGISFMGRGWDHTVPGVEFWTEALRLLKPSCYLVSMGGTRTWHRLACAIEDAGFEIRDTLMWLHGQGFPKGKACLKPAYEPIILARKPGPMRELGIEECRIQTGDDLNGGAYSPTGDRKWSSYELRGDQGEYKPPSGRWPANIVIDAAMADDLGDPGRFYFQGDYAWEDDVSLCSSCAERAVQIARHGTAATKACTATKTAAPTSNESRETRRVDTDRLGTGCCDGLRTDATDSSSSTGACGRTPTDPCPPDTSCTTSMATKPTTDSKTCASCGTAITSPITDSSTLPTTNAELSTPAESESPEPLTRWLYCAKASRSERNAGCEGMEVRQRDLSRNAEQPSMNGGEGNPYNRGAAAVLNHHPTVKPLALMRWLVKLVAQPGDVVLDPFAGSGTTGVACVMEGREFIGIEREAEYIEIARRRIEHASAQTRMPVG